MALPEPVSHDHHRCRFAAEIIRPKQPAMQRWNAENVKCLRTHFESPEALRIVDAGEHEVAPFPGGGLLERGDAALVIVELSRRNIARLSIAAAAGDVHEALRIAIRERVQQDAVDDAEEGGVCADADRESRDYESGEGGTPSHINTIQRRCAKGIVGCWFVIASLTEPACVCGDVTAFRGCRARTRVEGCPAPRR